MPARKLMVQKFVAGKRTNCVSYTFEDPPAYCLFYEFINIYIIYMDLDPACFFNISSMNVIRRVMLD